MGIAKLLPVAVLTALLTAPAVAPAQNVILDAPGFLPPKTARLPDVKPAPLAWPRLDPGAVMCRRESDLENLALRRSGQDAGPADCRMVTVPTAVTVVQRRGGRTLVKLTENPTISGWTDVWLPEKAPVTAGRQVR